MEAVDLARWTRFAAKGGIGKCTAICDCIAENADDLMFLKDDEITVLMQLEDSSGVYLGFCEGVIGRFSGVNVRFHSKLKKPIMAKRSSLSNASLNQGKSPTPPYGMKTPSPMAKGDSPAPHKPTSSRGNMSLDEQVSASFVEQPASTTSRPPSTAGPLVRRLEKSRLDDNSGTAFVAQKIAGGDQIKVRGDSAQQTQESSLLPLTASVSPITGSQTKTSTNSSHPMWKEDDQPPPGDVHHPIDAFYRDNVSRTPTPPLQEGASQAIYPSSSHTSVASASDRLSLQPTATVSNILTKADRAPTPLALSSTIDAPDLTTTTGIPNTSTSTEFDDSRISLALSDGEVGIGLSLLQDMADRGSQDGWSDSDSEEERIVQNPLTSPRRMSVKETLEGQSLPNEPSVTSAPSSRRASDRRSAVSESSRYSSEVGSDKLGYEDTETGHGFDTDELEADITRTQRAYLDIDSSSSLQPGQGKITPPPLQQMSFPSVAPLSPSRFRFTSSTQEKTAEDTTLEVGYTLDFPPPPTHTPQLHRADGSIIGPSSIPYVNTNVAVNANSDPGIDEHARRPSFARSTTSTSSDWEGAAVDIYDDYRYSRFSAGSSAKTRTSLSSSKTASIGSKFTGIGASDWGEAPPFPDNSGARSRNDSGASKPVLDVSSQSVHDAQQPTPPNFDASVRRQEEKSPTNPPMHVAATQVQGAVRTRSRSNTTASLNPAFNTGVRPMAGIPAAPAPLAVAQMPVTHPQQSLQDAITPAPRSHRHQHSQGSESDASVYTQSSSGKRSPGVDEPLEDSTPLPLSATGNRPAPLNLSSSNTRPGVKEPSGASLHGQERHHSHSSSTRSPLLHTSWGSPLASPDPHSHNLQPPPLEQMPSSTFLANGTVESSIHSTLNSSSPSLSSMPSTGYTGTGEGSKLGGGGRELSASATYLPGEARLGTLGRVISGPDRSPTGEARTAESLPDAHYTSSLPDEAEIASLHREGIKEGLSIVRDTQSEVEDERKPSAERNASLQASHGIHLGPSAAGENSTRAPSFSSPPLVPETGPLARNTAVPSATLNVVRSPPTTSSAAKNKSEEQPRQSADDTTKASTLNATTALPLGTHSSSTVLDPTAPNSTLPPPLTSISTPSSRPSLLDLRGLQPGQEQTQRQSLFLPHPNAPKAPASQSPGPMYVAQRQPPPQQPHTQHMRGGVLQAIHMALANRGSPKGPTIYGITTEDLSAATGPVLMHFSITPPPAKAPPPGIAPEPTAQNGHLRLASPAPIQAIRKVGSAASLDTATNKNTGDPTLGTSGGVIPRANFFPKHGGIRPRSRSFSGFQSTTAEIPLPIQRSHEEGSQLIEIPSASEVKRALSPIIASPTTPAPPHSPTSKNTPPKPSPLRVSSPLLQSHNSEISGKPSRPPNSPLGQVNLTRRDPFTHMPPTSISNQAKQQAGQIPLKLATSGSPSPSVSQPRPTLPGVHTVDTTPQPRPSVDTDAMSVHSTRSHIVSPPFGSGRHDSVRSKLSLPNLRKNRQDDISSPAPDSPAIDGAMLQVQDMDFELVRPNIPHLQAARTSEDSNVLGNNNDGSADMRSDTDRLRTESPLSPMTPHSPTPAHEGTVPGSGSWQPMKPANSQSRTIESDSSMDAHRQRELKWMSILASVSASQSRKSKKVKKLLLEGVPSSVRYLVWSHLTDGKGRCVPGVYAQLASRDRIPILVDVEKDVQKCFSDHPQLQSISGSVLQLLQAYLTMVPDVQYSSGLTSIAGQLLLLAPEEDAFWIFVSIMDTHTRPYFRHTMTQLDIDSSLFSRSLELIDPPVAKKLFVDLSILPSTVCRPWFTTLFIGSLPSNYVNRVWDIFLFEGIPLLFRVGLVLVSCCRRQILDSSSQEPILNTLLSPPHSLLPSNPEALVSLALDVKLKDDDIRKQRVKLEARAKRQTQLPRTVSAPTSISLPRTG